MWFRKPQIVATPPTFNPTPEEDLSFAEWRAAHLDRWLEANPDADPARRARLEAERDMYLAMIRMGK